MTSFFRPPNMRLLLAASLGANLLALALPMMTMQVYNRILTNHASDTLLVLSCGVVMAAMAECILRISRSAMVGAAGAQFEHQASTQTVEHLMALEPRAYEQTAPAILAQDVAAAQRLKDYYGGLMSATLLIDLPFVAVFLGLTIYLSGWLAVVPCVLLLIFGLFSMRRGMKLKELMSLRDAQDDRCSSFVTQTLHAVHTVKALCLEAVTIRRFEEVQHESGMVNYRIARAAGEAETLSYSSAQIMTVAVVCAGVPMVISGHFTVGTLIACVLLSGQIMQPLQRALALWVRHQDITLAKNRLKHLLSLKPRTQLAFEALAPNHGALKMEEVRFGYRPDHAVIDGANINVAPGDTIVLRGGPGSGKTTLLELMAGIYAPDHGRVLLSGMDVGAIPASERARYIAYLPTQGLVMRGNVMDNLTGFDTKLQPQARDMAALLGIEQAVAILPLGYDTPLEGLTGDSIPPGLKQRIAIARALLHRPRLILYDNADHGLDKESYLRIFDLLARLKDKATLILVTEDCNIASLADRVWEMRGHQPVPVMETSSVILDRRWLPGVRA